MLLESKLENIFWLWTDIVFLDDYMGSRIIKVLKQWSLGDYIALLAILPWLWLAVRRQRHFQSSQSKHTTWHYSISHWIPHTVTACNRYIDIFYQVSIINKVSSLESCPNTTPGKKENNQSFFTFLCGVCSFSPVQCTAVKNKLNYSSILHLNNI